MVSICDAGACHGTFSHWGVLGSRQRWKPNGGDALGGPCAYTSARARGFVQGRPSERPLPFRSTRENARNGSAVRQKRLPHARCLED